MAAAPFLLFLPYLALYFLFWALGAPIGALGELFRFLHFVLLAGLLTGALRLKLKSDWRAWLWLGIAAFLLLPGAYLEMPSDAWEHVRRLLRWQALTRISDAEPDMRGKFAYFFGWSFLRWLPLTYRHVFLDLYSGAWQLLVAVQVFRLSRRLGFDERVSFVQVFAFLVTFGSNVFGLRYYGLSSTLLAYAAYFEILIQLAEFPKERGRGFFAYLGFLFVLIAANHRQEVMFAFVSGAILLGVPKFQALRPMGRRKTVRIGLAAIVLGFLGGAVTGHWGFRVLSSGSPWFIETWGVHGILGLTFALALWKRLPLLGALTLCPVFLLLFPPSALVISKSFPNAYSSYRMLYCFPASFMLVAALTHALRAHKKWAPAAAVAVVLLLTSSPEYPWRGRLYFQLHRVPAERTFTGSAWVADWLAKNRDLAKARSCFILTDDLTRFSLWAEIGGVDRYRWGRLTLGPLQLQDYESTDHLIDFSQDPAFCFVLVPIWDELRATPPSSIARLSGQWYDTQGDIRVASSPEFDAAAAGLLRRGWTRTFIPPHYNLYEPPRSGF